MQEAVEARRSLLAALRGRFLCGAKEIISYGMRAFARELAQYKHAKGSVQFPHDEPLPLALIARIVKFRLKEAAET